MTPRDPVSRISEAAFPEAKRPGGPFVEGRFKNTVRSERLATILGICLWVGFTLCLLTGLISWFLQHPNWYFPWPAWWAGTYRITQGTHLVVGLALIPIILAKLWTVYPKLFQWPPFKSTPHLIERILLAPLIAGGIFVLVTGAFNIQYWYTWKFFFPTAHFWSAMIVMGALIVHIASQWKVITRNIGRRYRESLAGFEPGASGRPLDPHALERRRFLTGVGLASIAVAGLTAGDAIRFLRPVSILAPRVGNIGPQGFPVNKTARQAGATELAQDPNWRLVVTGRVAREVTLSRDDLLRMDQETFTLPIACVEGWSVSKIWTGPTVSAVLDLAGPDEGFEKVRFESLQPSGRFNHSVQKRPFVEAHNSLVALKVEGEDLALDHGFPARLMIPNQPGVLQTKWLSRIEVL